MSPPILDHVVARCLAKEPDERWQTASDMMRELKWIADGSSETRVASSLSQTTPPRLAVVIATMLGALVAGLAVWSLRPEPARSLIRVVATPPSSEPLYVSSAVPDVDVAITPDGTRIVYLVNMKGQRQLVVRALDQLEATALAGLGNTPRGPFLSPDGNWVGYFDGTSALRKVSILGGPPVTIYELGAAPRGASWGSDGTIIFATNPLSGLWRVPAGGGEPEELTKPEQGNHLWPEILPGGEAVLFTIRNGEVENSQIAVLSLATQEIKVLIPGGSNPRYALTGHIVYGVGGTLRAVGFDAERLEVTGDPVPVLDGVITKATGAADFSISNNGSLVYIGGSVQVGQGRLLWVDRDGREETLAAEPRAYLHPRISPDGSRVALDVRDQENDIWIWDFARETLRRLTVAPEGDGYPAWTPDGQRLAFESNRDGVTNLYWRAADGTGTVERLAESEIIQTPQVFSPDGKQLVYRMNEPQGGGYGLGVRSMDGDGPGEPLLASDFNEHNAEISPDGRWLAYQSDASGQYEIYVRPFPNVDGSLQQVSRGGGTQPLWARDGSELFYLDLARQLMAVSVRVDPGLEFGNPEIVFEQTYIGGGIGRSYDVSPDGERFLMIKEGANDESSPAELILVQNWFEELKRLVPTN